MHIIESKFKPKYAKKVYRSVLLRESYRENGKVKKRTIANLSKCSPEEISAIRLALAHKNDLSGLQLLSDVRIKEGLSIGSVWAVYSVAKKLGLEKALGNSFSSKLAMWQVIARVIEQGSRLSAVRLADAYALADILNIPNGFTEDNLYQNLKWLCDNQVNIENRLYKHRYSDKNKKCKLFLYDVTSSYLEGNKNELAEYGFNRDKKKGKKQIVIGLLCDEEGASVSVEVFTGNTRDASTFESQIEKTAARFNCQRVTFVGDRGMIKSGEIDNLKKVGFNYITAITKPQIETLLKKDVIQMELFTEDLYEVEYRGERYILRRNPVRTREIRQTREEKQTVVEKLIINQNKYLKEHFRAKTVTAIKKINNKINQLKIHGWVSVEIGKDNKRELVLKIDDGALAETARLDGCYVIKTDLEKEVADKQIIHDRYKDLTQVEGVFRTCKTTHLEIRPIFVTREESTRGHVLVVMLSYLIIRELKRAWGNIEVTVEEGLRQLGTICSMELKAEGKASCHKIPIPRKQSQQLLEALNIKLPKTLVHRKVNVVTRRKLKNK